MAKFKKTKEKILANWCIWQKYDEGGEIMQVIDYALPFVLFIGWVIWCVRDVHKKLHK